MDKKTSIWWAVCFGAFSFFLPVYSQIVPPLPPPMPIIQPGVGILKITNVPKLFGPKAGNNGQGVGNNGQGVGNNGQGVGNNGQGNVNFPAKPGLVRPYSGQVQNNEFQLFIERSTGQALPMFGRKLFQGAGGGFAPAENIPVTADYVVGPGDELIIRAWGQIDINLSLIVDRNGAINVPRVGVLQVAGLKANQLEGFIKTQVGRVFKNFEMNVTFGRLRSIKVLVVGHAQRPGNYTVSSLGTLLSTLLASGGPSSVGSMRRIELRRNNTAVTTMDLYDLLLEGDNAKDQRVLHGDIIRVLPLGSMVALTGSVQLPAIYELKGEETVGDMLETAGGLTATAFSGRLTMERITENSRRQVVELKLDDQGRKTKVQNGDFIQVLPISPRFDQVVTLNGHVQAPRRLPWKEGTRISDLIPDTSYLIPHQFWQRKNNLAGRGDGLSPRELTRRLLQDINWQYATITRLNDATLENELIIFNLGLAMRDNDPEHNYLLEPGDVVTIYNQSEIRVPKKMRDILVTLEGEVENPGIYPIRDGETLVELIRRVGGFTADAYPYGSVFTRDSVRLQQEKRMAEGLERMEKEFERSAARLQAETVNPNLKESYAVQLEAKRKSITRMRSSAAVGRIVLNLSPNTRNVEDLPHLQLKDGDTLVVPSKMSEVHLFGEVYNRQSSIWEPGETVLDALTSAGGPTKHADVKAIFIIRADGSTYSNEQAGRKFTSTRLSPGDSIVVPENMDFVTWKHEVREWAQIFANFALGAAAIKVLSD